MTATTEDDLRDEIQIRRNNIYNKAIDDAIEKFYKEWFLADPIGGHKAILMLQSMKRK